MERLCHNVKDLELRFGPNSASSISNWQDNCGDLSEFYFASLFKILRDI